LLDDVVHLKEPIGSPVRWQPRNHICKGDVPGHISDLDSNGLSNVGIRNNHDKSALDTSNPIRG